MEPTLIISFIAIMTRQGDVPYLLHVGCAVYARCLVQRRVNRRQRGEVKYAAEAEVLPYCRYRVYGRETVRIGHVLIRRNAQMAQQVIDKAVYVKEGNDHTGDDNRRYEVGHVRLYHVPHKYRSPIE